VTPKLLLFYYLLAYEAKRRETILTVLSALQNPNNSSQNSLTAIIAALTMNSSGVSSSANTLANRLIATHLEAMLNFKYPQEIFDHIPINYFLIKAKEADFLIMYPALLKHVINLFTQLCQVEHCLYEPKIGKHVACVAEKWKSLDYLIQRIVYVKKSAAENELTRSEAYMFKILWFKAYSVHGRKCVLVCEKKISFYYEKIILLI
jgi:hypothetical protein